MLSAYRRAQRIAPGLGHMNIMHAVRYTELSPVQEFLGGVSKALAHFRLTPRCCRNGAARKLAALCHCTKSLPR
jgi:hypothetical protein